MWDSDFHLHWTTHKHPSMQARSHILNTRYKIKRETSKIKTKNEKKTENAVLELRCPRAVIPVEYPKL